MIGIIHIEDETFITDRDNQERIPVEGVEIRPNWDIDRAGSKGAAQITAENGVLEPGMWLSTYRTITPERGEIIRYPRGHWHLANPGITYDGGYEMDTGAVSQVQTANASDIVDDLAGVALREAFYTPVRGHVMTDVHNLIQMGSCGIMGPNLVTNGSFEDGFSGWGQDILGGPSVQTVVAGPDGNWGFTAPVPHGDVYRRITFYQHGAPSGSVVQMWRVVSLPPGTQVVYASAWAYQQSSADRSTMRLVLEFRNPAGTLVKTTSVSIGHSERNSWRRLMVFAEVPDTAATVTLLPQVVYHATGATIGPEIYAWDDIRLGTCTHMPIPDDRINLPASDALATTRIQTAENKNLLYDAINADRLSATGHYALATDMEGHLTSQPIRTLANATPRYTFGPNDIEIVDDVSPEIIASNTRPYNHWFAVKEDFEDASASMRADSYNNNANDRFSVVNSGGVSSAPQITVQDAVSVDALQAIADQARDSYSLSETVRFAIMPLDLTVYDVVAIDDPDMPDISGVWAVNSIDASGDYLVITATRAVSREV